MDLKAREAKLLQDIQAVTKRIEDDRALLQRLTGALLMLREMAVADSPSPSPEPTPIPE